RRVRLDAAIEPWWEGDAAKAGERRRDRPDSAGGQSGRREQVIVERGRTEPARQTQHAVAGVVGSTCAQDLPVAARLVLHRPASSAVRCDTARLAAGQAAVMRRSPHLVGATPASKLPTRPCRIAKLVADARLDTSILT